MVHLKVESTKCFSRNSKRYYLLQTNNVIVGVIYQYKEKNIRDTESVVKI